MVVFAFATTLEALAIKSQY